MHCNVKLGTCQISFLLVAFHIERILVQFWKFHSLKNKQTNLIKSWYQSIKIFISIYLGTKKI